MADQETIIRLKGLAAQIRKNIITMIGDEGHVGHLGGSCSSADIIAVLYGHKMRLDPKNPRWEGRDKFLMSKGHAAIAQYAVMAELGYFSPEHLPTLKSLGSILQGHPDIHKTPGIEANTGSLGQGLSIANGMALAMRLDKSDRKVYCIMGDGEIAEGQIWEAAMSASNFNLDNVVGILDHNGLQASGRCVDRFKTGPLPEKWVAFGWHVIEIDGHDIEQIISALDQADTVKGKPVMIIAHTTKGKGVSFAENVVKFHNGCLTKDECRQALSEQECVLAECQGGCR